MVVVCWSRIILCVRIAVPYESSLRVRVVISSRVAFELRQNSEVQCDDTVTSCNVGFIGMCRLWIGVFGVVSAMPVKCTFVAVESRSISGEYWINRHVDRFGAGTPVRATNESNVETVACIAYVCCETGDG